MIFCTHRELRWRHAWPETRCRGRMVVDPLTEEFSVWLADCDECGLTIGITPRQRERWLHSSLKHESHPKVAPNILAMGTGGGVA